MRSVRGRGGGVSGEDAPSAAPFPPRREMAPTGHRRRPPATARPDTRPTARQPAGGLRLAAVEALEVARLLVGRVDVADTRVARSLGGCALDLGDRVGLALEPDLDRAVRRVGGPAGDVALRRTVLQPGAVVDAL